MKIRQPMPLTGFWRFFRESLGRFWWIWLLIVLFGTLILFSPSPFGHG